MPPIGLAPCPPLDTETPEYPCILHTAEVLALFVLSFFLVSDRGAGKGIPASQLPHPSCATISLKNRDTRWVRGTERFMLFFRVPISYFLTWQSTDCAIVRCG